MHWKGDVNSEPALTKCAPKVVVFDLGKVLLDFDYRVAAEGLANRSDASRFQIQEFIDQSPLLNLYEKGKITREGFFDEIQRMSGYRGSLRDFSALFSDVFTPIEPMIQLKERLTAARIPTCLFSNTNDLAIEHIQAAYPFYKEFDGYVLSYELGFMKPEKELYEAVETITEFSGSEILYIDDREENIVASASRGWNALLHTSSQASIQWLEQQGLSDLV